MARRTLMRPPAEQGRYPVVPSMLGTDEMAFLIGTDEAGYGPNLGPLVVAATLWEVPDKLLTANLYDRLAPDVVAAPPPRVSKAAANGQGPALAPLLLADSKVVYQSNLGIAALERGVLAALAAIGPAPSTWQALWPALACADRATLAEIPWYATYDAPLPSQVAVDDLAAAGKCFAAALARADIRLLAVQCRAVCAGQFNAAVERYGNKGTVLSKLTIELVAALLAQAGAGKVHVISDKHGGRNRYMPLLQTQFVDELVTVGEESRQRSLYRFATNGGQHVEWAFCQGAEINLPAAVASMAAKYLREQAMAAFNHFWRCHVPELKPTAGYPGDARRFRRDIGSRQAELKIDDRLLWRCC